MMPAASDPPVIAELAHDTESEESRLRLRAFQRAWLCPGAGLALLGHPLLALVNWLANLATLVAGAWFAIAFDGLSGLVAGGLLLVGVTIWTVEQVGVFFFPLRPSRPKFLAQGYWVWTLLMGTALFGELATISFRLTNWVLDYLER